MNRTEQNSPTIAIVQQEEPQKLQKLLTLNLTQGISNCFQGVFVTNSDLLL